MKSLVLRLKIFLDYKQLGITELSVLLGYKSPQKLYRLFNTDNASPSCQIIEDIAERFYELDLNWLFTGRGQMLQTSENNIDYKEKYFECLVEKENLYKKLLK